MGTCSPVPAGQDPLDQCPADSPQSCGRDGVCNGSGGCRLYQPGVICAPATCAGSVFTQSRICDGAGVCRPAASTDCAPGTCTPSGCGGAANDAGTVDGGSCGPDGCFSGSICCGGRCTDPKFDHNNCGGCGMVCINGQSCLSGVCACDSMSRDCGG